jgi:hypothetical protein
LGPFRLLRSSPQRTIYVANPKFHESGHPRLQQIVETRYATSAQRLRALEKRQVDLVPFVPPTQAKKVEALEGVRLVRMGQPAVHVLQFNFDRELLNDRTLRRAIDYAIDREAVMRAIGVEPDEQNCVVTAPLPHGSFGYDVQIAPREPNPTLAKAVIMGLKKKHGSLPALTLTHTGNESTLEACRRIAQSLKDVGLNVTVVDRYDERGGGLRGDLRFESYIVREPLYHLITLLTRENPSLVDHTTPWLRQQLIELQNVPHFTAAKALLPSLHRTLHEDIAVLPLWQTYDWFAVSDAIAGVPESPETVYDDVHRWTVAPTFPPADWRTPQTPEASAQADAEPKSP